MSESDMKYLFERINVLETKLDALEAKFYVSLANLGGIVILVVLRIVDIL